MITAALLTIGIISCFLSVDGAPFFVAIMLAVLVNFWHP